MKIAVKQDAPDAFSLSIDETQVSVDGAGLKALLVEITRILAPGAGIVETDEEQARKFIGRMQTASDVGIQKLLLLCRHDDMLVLLKAAENDKAMLRKLYGNMSERSRKIFVEDLVFKFRDGLPAGRLRQAIDNLSRCVRQLESDGTLVYGSAPAA